MIVPLRTDAPIYHYPVITIGIIVANVVAFAATGAGDPETVEPWALAHGDGLHPIQWVTSNFMHGDFMHLIGNMVFLWGFGLVVEGKLGWWKYLLVYLGIGIAQSSIEQVAMLGYDKQARMQEYLDEWGFEIEEALEEEEGLLREEGAEEDEIKERLAEYREEMLKDAEQFLPPSFSLGASAVIYGLLAISLVWAPKNEVTVLVIIFYRGATFEITIMTFACWYIGLELLASTATGFSMSSATLHAMGAIIGFGIGVALFKLKMVDCEDWDLFAVLSGHYGPWARDQYGNKIDRDEKQHSLGLDQPDSSKKKKKKPSQANRNRKLEEIVSSVESGDFLMASDALYNLRIRDKNAMPDEETLQKLAAGLMKEGLIDEAMPLMEECIEIYPDNADGIRLRLANCYLKQGDTDSAVQVMRDIDREGLSEKQQQAFRKLVKAAKR